MADPYVVGVKIKINRFDMITMGGKVGGVWNKDREHCAHISWSFLAYGTIMHDGGFVRAWNGASILQNYPFAWRHVEYCWSVIMTTHVLSYVIPIYLSLISYGGDTSPCGTCRLKISYIWSCCTLSYIGTSMSSKNMGKCIIEGSCDLMCLSILLSSSTGSISGDSILCVAASI